MPPNRTASGKLQPTQDKRFCSALGWVGSIARARPILPFVSLRYFGYTLLSLLVVLGLMEGALRYLSAQGSVISSDWVSENDAIDKMNLQKVLTTSSDPVWRSNGIAVPERSPGVSRILTLGDSFVWGDGYLNANDIWWRQLQRELQHRGYFDVEVVAAGLKGASTQQQLDWLNDPGLLTRIDPDIVVLGYVTNDPDVRSEDGRYLVRQIGREVPMPDWPMLDATLGRILPVVTAQLKPRLTSKWASKVEGAFLYADWELEILESPNIEAYGEIVQSLGDWVRESGRPFFVVTLPGAPTKEAFESRYSPVAPLFAAARLPFFDLIDAFVREYPATNAGVGSSVLQWGVNPVNGHPGPVATRFYARQVTDILERDFPHVLGVRFDAEPGLVPKINDWMPPAATVTETGPSQWRLLYPRPDTLAPRLPLGEPHVVLAFDLPVAIRKVKLSGEMLDGARLWFTSVDPVTGVDRGDLLGGDARRGATVEWVLGGTSGVDSVNTLRIAADLAAQIPVRTIEPSRDALSRWGGHAFAFAAPDLAAEADDEGHLSRSEWVLLEDGVPLKPAHASHADIETNGRGRWSHWKEQVIFSASDNSNAKKNGRRYQLVSYPPEANELRLEIEFDEVAVRP